MIAETGSRQRFAVTGALAAGEKLEAGNFTIENRDGELLIGVGKNFAAVIREDGYAGGEKKYRVETYGNRHTRKISPSELRTDNSEPLVKLGQGTSTRKYYGNGGGNGAA